MFVQVQLTIAESSIAEVLDVAGLGEERIKDANGLGPVAGSTELGKLLPIGSGSHALSMI